MKLLPFFRNTGFVLIFNGITLACGLFKNLVLARNVSEAELGLYSLVLAVVSFVYPLSLVGQQTALVRFLSGKDVDSYDCVGVVSKILTISSILVLLGTLLATLIYDLMWLPVLFIAIFALSNGVTDLVPGVLRAKGNYRFSIVVFRGVNIFHLVGFLLLAGLGIFTLTNVFWLLISVTASFAVFIYFISIRQFGRGKRPLPASLWRDGYFFFGTHVSVLVITSIDRLLIPKLLSLEALGLYFAILAVMRIFELSVNSIEFVLLPSAHRLGKRQIVKISLALLVAGGLLAVAYLWGGGFLVSIIYGGRYDHGIFLIPYFCVIGLLSLIYVVPYSLISGRLPAKSVRHLLYGNLVTMAINIALSFIMISEKGLVGATLATIIVWTLRIAIALVIIVLARKEPKLSSFTEAGLAV